MDKDFSNFFINQDLLSSNLFFKLFLYIGIALFFSIFISHFFKIFLNKNDKRKKINDSSIISQSFKYILYGLLVIFSISKIFAISQTISIFIILCFLGFFIYMAITFSKNYIFGILILFNQKIKIGTRICCDKFNGHIIHFGATQFQIVNDFNDVLFIPNSLIFTNQLSIGKIDKGFKVCILLNFELDQSKKINEETLKLPAIVSPYRMEGTTITINKTINNKNVQFDIEFFVWSYDLKGIAMEHYNKNLKELTIFDQTVAAKMNEKSNYLNLKRGNYNI